LSDAAHDGRMDLIEAPGRRARPATGARDAGAGPLRFPEGFLWGAATSAHQVEGGNRANDWWPFEQEKGRVYGGDRSGDACRHYELFDRDFALAAGDRHNAHRLSIEWSRIEPARGRIDAAAVAHYHAVFQSLRRHGLEPLVTLHHFTNPLWLAAEGGWENRAAVDRFETFVRFCAREYGGEVDWWLTINEPEVYAFRGWSEGVWPPARRDDSLALAVIAHQLEAHARAYRVLHAEDRADADGDGHAARVGFAKHYVVLEPEHRWSPLDHMRTYFEHRVFNEAVLAAPVTGEIDLSIPGARGVKRSLAELKGAQDFVGLNYYTRWKVRAFGGEAHVAARHATLNDLGWELHPGGIRDAVRAAARAGKPILVTENGTADAEDRFRGAAIVETLAALHDAMRAGADVRGYFHWSLMDNFEWADGYRGRFGLYAVDFRDPERTRTPRPSATLFAEIAAANAVDPTLPPDARARAPGSSR
jgi:beta-glucosidase